jgi:hypothetical protein
MRCTTRFEIVNARRRVGNVAKVQNAHGLSGSQVIILNILGKASTGMTAHEISFAGKVPVNTQNIGPAYTDRADASRHTESLVGRGMVRAEQWEGDDVRWYITDLGKKFSTLKGRVVGATTKLPSSVIDPVALAMKKTRTYPFEEYTVQDMEEFRNKLPKEWHHIDLDDLRRQAQARRKQGIFSDPDEKREKAVRRVLREFGPRGTVMPEFLTEDQMGQLYGIIGHDVTADVEE